MTIDLLIALAILMFSCFGLGEAYSEHKLKRPYKKINYKNLGKMKWTQNTDNY